MKQMNSNILIGLFTLFVMAFISCDSGKSTTVTNNAATPDPKPTWVDQRPVNGAYYIGIGSASKTAQPLDFQNIAKKNALNDLASEISVRVQGSTFLNTLEVNKAFSEEFISTINTTTDEKIEDFEVAGIWEDKTTYYIYYRLNKATYQQKKQMKKNQAMSSANDFLQKGKDAEAVANIPAAMDLYIRGLFALQDYWNEVNEYTAESGRVFLDNELYSSLQRISSGLIIRPTAPNITLAAENNYTANSSVQIIYAGKPVRGITTTHVYPKSRFMRPRVVVSDENGSVGFVVDDINTREKDLSVSFSIDLMPLQPQDLDKRITGALIKNLQTDTKKIPIEFIAPSFQITSNERVYGNPGTSSTLSSTLQSELVKRGLRQLGNAAADYQITIDANSTEGGASQGFTVALLEMTIVVKSKAGEIVFKESVNNLKGLQLNRDAASVEAYKKGRERITEQLVPSILEAIF